MSEGYSEIFTIPLRHHAPENVQNLESISAGWLSAALSPLWTDDVRFYHVLLIFPIQSDNYGAVVMTKGLFSRAGRSSEAVTNEQTAFCSC